MTAAEVNFTSYAESIAKALDLINARETIDQQSSILLKPNLINDSPHPVTTPVECCQAVIDYIRLYSKGAEIVIAEGCGSAGLETVEVFNALRYDELAKRYGIRLVDLNCEPLKLVENSDCICFPKMYLPEIAFTHFIISIPVLKAHSLALFTGALKNMMGFAPPSHYSGDRGSWKKAVFHNNIHQSITELIRYRSPDLSIIDASVGLSEFHLGGPPCDPPANKIIAGFDPYAVDRKAASLLSLDWRNIKYLQEK